MACMLIGAAFCLYYMLQMKEDKTVDLSAGLTVTPLRLDTAASATDSQQNRDGQSEKDSPS